VAKSPFLRKILKKGWKSRIPGLPGGCFYINPSRRGPVPGLAGQSRPGTRSSSHAELPAAPA